MEFKYLGKFGGKYFRLDYSIEEELIMKLCEDRGIDYELITDEEINYLGLELLKDNLGDGLNNRTDIIIRTDDQLLTELEEFRITSDRLTLYERFLTILIGTKPGTIMWDRLEEVNKVSSIEDVLAIINTYEEAKRDG